MNGVVVPLESQIYANRRLIAAVLQQAVYDYAAARKYLEEHPRSETARQELDELEEWLDSDSLVSGAENGLTFRWICEELGIAHDSFRERIRSKWRVISGTPLMRSELRARQVRELLAQKPAEVETV